MSLSCLSYVYHCKKTKNYLNASFVSVVLKILENTSRGKQLKQKKEDCFKEPLVDLVECSIENANRHDTQRSSSSKT